MQKMRMTKPGKVKNTTVSAEVLNDPRQIAMWEKRGYKTVGVIDDDMDSPANAVPMNVREDDLNKQNAAAAATKTKATPVDGLLESLGQDVIDVLKDNGLGTVEKLKKATQKQLVALPEIGKARAKRIAALIAEA